jgi:hypothetical protein
MTPTESLHAMGGTLTADDLKALHSAADCAGLEMEFLELRRDAERYRKLRAQRHSNTPRISVPFEPGLTYTPEALDAALDALPDPE